MNSFLLNRSLGSISPAAFHVAQSRQLVHSLEPAPAIRFSGDDASTRIAGEPTDGTWRDEELEKVWAHKAGVNVLVIDQYEGR